MQKLNEFVAAREEIEQKRVGIDTQIVYWKQLVDSLRTVLEPDESEDSDPPAVQISGFAPDGKAGRQTLKFTDAVRLVLKQLAKDTHLSAPDIRFRLLNFGFDLSDKTQPLSPIHNCLRRLSEQGEAAPVKNDEGQIIGYKWISPIERALDEENSYYAVLGTGINQRTPNAYHDIYQNMAEMAVREKGKKEKK